MVLEFFLFRLENNIKAFGKMENCMVIVIIQMKTMLLNTVYGKMVKELYGATKSEYKNINIKN